MSDRGMALLSPGSKAPDFQLPDENGQLVRLSEAYAAGPVVVYFYPKDDTPGCTAEACRFRDDYQDFTDRGARVIGISRDDAAAHRAFKAKHRLPFSLLTDADGAVGKSFGVGKFLGVLAGRATSLIDRDGTIRLSFSSAINMQAHIEEALGALRALG